MTSTGISTGVATPPLPEASHCGADGGALEEGRDYAGRQLLGARPLQEDSYGVVPRAEFAGGPRDLFLVVADGMGGHAAGEVASALAVQSFADTFMASAIACDAGRLWDCLEEANRRIGRELANRGRAVEGMGTTLLAVLLRCNEVRWISVGDSPLLLVRERTIRRLNRIHSRAEELAEKVAAGLMTAEEARQDPSRHVLVSALIGERIFEVDDPPPVSLRAGDVLVAATDGLDTLREEEIAAVLEALAAADATAMAEGLLQAVASKQEPKQDNTTVVVVRVPG